MNFCSFLNLLCVFVSVFGASIENHDDKIRPLESFNIDPDGVSISGLSSGASFTSNFYVAHSALFKGAGIFAGRPYGCRAPNNLGCRNITAMVEYTHQQAAEGKIDPVDNLIGKPLYVFHGENDWMVSPSGAPVIVDYYTAMQNDVKSNISDNVCGHGTPSLDQGIRCDGTWLPGVNNCGWSGAYHVMDHIYGDLKEPMPQEKLHGQWVEFDQTEFTQGILRHSFADTGFVYYPSGCLDRTKVCKLHVSVHGCFIVSWLIGDKYALHSGHNEVGELNDIVVVHPQLTSTLPNIGGCWGGGQDPDTKDAAEIRIVLRMINRIMGN